MRLEELIGKGVSSTSLNRFRLGALRWRFSIFLSSEGKIK